jgi:pimeloyl-ACP methyl ester carboxylesterase
MKNSREAIVRPSVMLAALEIMRAGFEGWNLLMSGRMLDAAPHGDGHGVLVLPGFATGDESTVLLRSFLRTLGYDVHPWRLGWNLDHLTVGSKGEHLTREIDNIHRTTGRKVSLVGWSLGGVIAREAARRNPQAVRQVLSIGSPIGGNPQANNLGTIYEWLSGNKVNSPATLHRFTLGPQALSMPSSALFSKTDGITAWQNCLAIPDHQTENIEVQSSHFGMLMNPIVFHIIADRLAQAENEWSPFVSEAQNTSL